MASRFLRTRSSVRHFGRGRQFLLAAPVAQPAASLTDDLQLFATWFLGGFLFMSIYLA